MLPLQLHAFGLIMWIIGLGSSLQVPEYHKPSMGVLFRNMGRRLYATTVHRDVLFKVSKPRAYKTRAISPVTMCHDKLGDNISVSGSIFLQRYKGSDHLLGYGNLQLACHTLETDLNSRIAIYNRRLDEITNITASLTYLLKEFTYKVSGNVTARGISSLIGSVIGPTLGLSTAEEAAQM